jgi:hypothetical protein
LIHLNNSSSTQTQSKTKYSFHEVVYINQMMLMILLLVELL